MEEKIGWGDIGRVIRVRQTPQDVLATLMFCLFWPVAVIAGMAAAVMDDEAERRATERARRACRDSLARMDAGKGAP